jgi:hypothetical protein
MFIFYIQGWPATSAGCSMKSGLHFSEAKKIVYIVVGFKKNEKAHLKDQK